MKSLIASFLLLASLTVFGAVPDYKAFRGTGGILVTSNPPIGTITFDGSGISSPTGGVSAATVTNIVTSIGGNFRTNAVNGSAFFFIVPGIGTNAFQIADTNGTILVFQDTNGVFNVSNFVATGSNARMMGGTATNAEFTSTSIKLFGGGSAGRAFIIGPPGGADRSFTYSNGTLRLINASAISTLLHSGTTGSGTTTLPGTLNVGQFLNSTGVVSFFATTGQGTNRFTLYNSNLQAVVFFDTNDVFSVSNLAVLSALGESPGPGKQLVGYDSSGLVVWSNSVSGISAATATNIVNSYVNTTTICYTSSYLNTNILIASGFGTASANGTYNWSSGQLQFTNGINAIRFDSGYGGWILTNGASGVLYDVFGTPAAPGVVQLWDDVVNGAGPLGRTSYGPITNCFTNTSFTQPANFPVVGTNIYLSEFIGNDTNGVRGRIDRKFKTIAAALAIAGPGDTLDFEAGDYPWPSGTQVLTLTNDMHLIGAGRGITRIGTEGGQQEILQSHNNVVLSDLTFHGALHLGDLTPGSGPYCSNNIVNNCDILGNADGIYLSGFFNFRGINSRMVAGFDGVADWDCRPGGSNRVARFYNCDILVTNSGSFSTLHGFNGGDSRIEMYGGSIEVHDGTTDNAPVYLNVDTYRTNKSGSVLLSNVRLRSSVGGNVAPFVTNFNSLAVILDNCTVETINPVLTSGVYTNQTSDRLVAIPNGSARTNRLVNTLAFTNSLAQYSANAHEVTIYDKLGTASVTNIVIKPFGTQKINGQSSTTITQDYGSITLVIDGTNWTVKSTTVSGGSGGNFSTNTDTSATFTGAISQSGGGTVDLSGALKVTGGNIIDSGSDIRITIPNNSDTIIYGSHDANIGLTIDKDGLRITSSNATFLALPGSGSIVAADTGGALYRTNVTGGSGGNFSTNTDGSANFTGGAASEANVVLFATNGQGVMAFTLPGNYPGTITNRFNFTNGAPGQVLTVVSSNNNVLTWGISNAPAVSTALSNLTDVKVTNMVNGDLLAWNGAMQKWTNQSVFFQYFITEITTNVTIFAGTNAEQSVLVATNNSFGLTFTGTPKPGEKVNVAVFNTNQTASINMTNRSYNPLVASNVVFYTIPTNSIASFTFVNRTNFGTGTNRWELDRVIDKEMELIFGSGITATTNAAGSAITLSAATPTPMYSKAIAGVGTDYSLGTGDYAPVTFGTTSLTAPLTNGTYLVNIKLSITGATLLDGMNFRMTNSEAVALSDYGYGSSTIALASSRYEVGWTELVTTATATTIGIWGYNSGGARGTVTGVYSTMTVTQIK